MRCETARTAISQAMDDLRAVAPSVTDHVSGCAECRDFIHGVRRIRELDWTRGVPPRTVLADLPFRQPEGLLVRVHHHTPYPSARWPRNDLSPVSDGHKWEASGPNPCPRAEVPACPQSQPVVRTVV